MESKKEDTQFELFSYLFNKGKNSQNKKSKDSNNDSIYESIKSLGYNLKYSLFHLGNSFSFQKTLINVHIYSKLFQNVNPSIIRKIKKKFDKLAHFCYRKNYSFFNSNLESDTGWGCMIRCYQMLMYRAFYKILKMNKMNKNDAKIRSLCFFQETPFLFKDIPDIFIEHFNYYLGLLREKGLFNSSELKEISFLPPFSIQNICLFGQKFFNVQPGQFYSDVVLANIFSKINKHINLDLYCNILCFQTNIILSEIISESLTNVNQIKKEINNNEIIQFPDIKEKYVLEKPIIIFISVKLSLDRISEDYLNAIKHLFTFKGFLGILGGKAKSAYYFFGYFNDKYFLFLDPHISKDRIKNFEAEKNTYFIKDINYISLKNIESSFTVGMLIKDKNQFETFINFCEDHSKLSKPCFGLIKKENTAVPKEFDNIMNDKDDF